MAKDRYLLSEFIKAETSKMIISYDLDINIHAYSNYIRKYINSINTRSEQIWLITVKLRYLDLGAYYVNPDKLQKTVPNPILLNKINNPAMEDVIKLLNTLALVND